MPFPRSAFFGNQTQRRDPSARETQAAASKADAEYEATLVRRFVAGEAAPFDEIVARYREKLFCVAFALLRNRADAEEIVQDTFVRAYRGLHRFRGDCSLATWLHRITVNLARNRYWYFFRRRRHTTLSLDRSLTEESGATFSDLLASGAPSPRMETVTAEFSDLIVRCMDKLEPHQREILTLRNILNRSYADIAQQLGINEGTVKSRIARARGNLRALMAEECPEFPEDANPGDWLEREAPPTGHLHAGT